VTALSTRAEETPPPVGAAGPARGFATWALLLVWLLGVAYAAAALAPPLGAGVKMGLAFNEMLANLLHGRFDISPQVIANEAFVRDGRTYAYFGVFCAILRAPLLLAGRLDVDMTAASLLIAAAVSLACRLAAASLVLRKSEGADLPAALRVTLAVAIAANGESLQFLHPSLYQEVVSWGAALASVFVLLALKMILGAAPRTAAAYGALALVAGLALTCRVSTGLGLYGALGLMLAVEAWRGLRARRAISMMRRLAPAAVVLALFAGAVGGVNYARWGDPLSFSPLRYQAVTNRTYPDRMARLETYGESNLRRVPFALQYYFTPVWAATDARGEFILRDHQVELFELVELPPGSILLSDPVICVLAAIGLWALFARPAGVADPALARAALAGLAVPGGLMLTLGALCFRYRMEFYPALDFAGWLGLAALASRARPLPKVAVPAFGGLAVAGMVVAAASLMAYAIVPFGTATDFDTSRGWTGVIANRLEGRELYRGHLMRDGSVVPLPKP